MESSATIDVKISDKFYLDVVAFKVENTIYKILRQPIVTTSVVFKDMFETSTSTPGTMREGRSDDHPIVLEGTKAADWEFFLTVLLKPDAVHAPEGFGTFQEWTALLELSRRWIMKSMHDIACRTLASHGYLSDPVLGIRYAREYNRSEWLVRGFHDLVTRDAAITPDTATLCQLDQLLQLYELRVKEKVRKSSVNSACTFCQSQVPVEAASSKKKKGAPSGKGAAMQEIRNIFEDEIKGLDEEHRRTFE